ncbi:MAG: hypothetical protein NDJ72_05175 [Elusimicrobia bacterium]|nr:hypothetical protein [Elusimicrobiota bacterium]
MNISEIKPGDRLDWPARELKNGEVVRVGHATVWLVFALATGGHFPITADPRDLTPHVDHARIRLGAFLLRDQADGRVWLESTVTGEAMQTDTAKLERLLARFFRREF